MLAPMMKRDATVLDGNNQSISCTGANKRCCSNTRYDAGSSLLQFLVRYGCGDTTLIYANVDATVESVHEIIRQKTRIPVPEQGYLTYRGKQLQMDKTLGCYSIQTDAQLELVPRRVIDDVNRLISKIGEVCKGACRGQKMNVIDDVQEFIDMSLSDGATALGYNQIFVSEGAAAALVRLFVSPGNEVCAKEAIRLFLKPLNSDKLVRTESRIHTFPIILEFCKLLCRKTSSKNPLYISCLDTLRKMLAPMYVPAGNGVENLSSSDAERKLVIPGLSLFVSELGREVIKDMDSCTSSQQTAGKLPDDVGHFTSFLDLLGYIVVYVLGDMGLLPINFINLQPCYIEGLRELEVVYIEMLREMDGCLVKVESDGKIRAETDHQYLSILKALNSLSKLYKGAEEKLTVVLRSRQVAFNALILNTKRDDGHRWILEHKDLTSYESRRHLTMMLLPELKGAYQHLFRMRIDRERLLADSFKHISEANVKDLVRGRLFIQFENEVATGPGVLREWFCSVCQALLNPQNVLFVACQNDNRRFYPNPLSDVNPFHREYFQFFGRVIALSLVYKVQLGILFDRTFFLQLSGETVSLEDVRDADPIFYSSCKKILEMDTDLLDSDALGLTFTIEIEKFGSRTTVELCPGGNSIALNSKNREAYVNLLIQQRFVNSVSNQVKNFAKGFSEVLCEASLLAFFFQSLKLEDLDRMLHGSDRAICVEEWKAHTDYNGWKKTNRQITWFWKIVEGLSDEQRRVLLFFWTSVKYLPVGGFGGLQSRLYISKPPNYPADQLPSAHTCFYRLCLPNYKYKATLQKSLQIITQEHLSCSFGMG